MRQFAKGLLEEERGAIRLAGLAESMPLGRKPTQLDWPETRNQDYHLALKRKLIGAEGKYGRLEPTTRLRCSPGRAQRSWYVRVRVEFGSPGLRCWK